MDKKKTDLGAFEGMTEQEGIDFQLTQWVAGNSLHNPYRDECCPDFSCCNAGIDTPKEDRERFMKYHKGGNEAGAFAMLGSFLGGLLVENKMEVAGTLPTINQYKENDTNE